MNLSALLAPLLHQLLLKPIQKVGVWATRQIDGKAAGDTHLAADKPLYDAAEGAVAGTLTQAALSQVGAAHVTADKIAKALGVPTTEEGLSAALGQRPATLDLSNPAAVLSLLAQNLVKPHQTA